MNASQILNKMKNELKLTDYMLAKILGVSQSLIHYVINGKSNIAFNTMIEWISKLGFSIKGKQIEINQFKYVSSPFYLIQLINKNHTEQKWLDISVAIGNIIQNAKYMKSDILKINLSKLIIETQWKAFYCGLVDFIFTNIFKDKSPKWTSQQVFILKKEWTPSKNLSKSQDFDVVFAKHNILIPVGELQCL
ncbi:MAG: helix-turn-helix domain-containing protein [Mycoplasmataceae bacterium]|jgi:predicted transcriptional regulator|nr:helix-turn-helix domain-containing protein [Mycoplasmataceae bacterium]